MGQRRATPLLVLRSAIFALGQTLATVVFATLAIAALALPYRMRYHVVTQWSHLNLWWLGIACGLTHEVEGQENIPDRPTIVLCKHESAWETLSLQQYFSPQVWVLKRELLMVPFFGWGLATLRPIAIDRRSTKSAMTQILEQGRDRLARGSWVVVFPEGTRIAPGKQGRYKLGGAALAERTGYPVVPVAHDSGDYWPRNSFLKRPGRIRMVIGPPIQTAGRKAAEINAEAEAWIEGTVARLRGHRSGTAEVRRGPGVGGEKAPHRVPAE